MADSLRGAFVWCELMTTDTGAAGAFYTKVVGWKAAASAAATGYTEFASPAGAVAGMMALPDEARKMGAPPNWMIYIGTPDVDATARRIGALGGGVLKPPADIPNVGRFAVVRDPQGAVFAIFTPSTQAPAGPPPRGFSWYELYAPDPDAAWTFYSTLFGWEKTSTMDMGEMGLYQMFGHGGGIPNGGVMKPPPGAPAAWMPYIAVADARDAAAKAARLGGAIVQGPRQVPGGDWIAMGRDPQGAMFAVHSRKSAAARPAAKATPKKAAARKPAAKKPAAKKAAPKKTAAKTAARTRRASKGRATKAKTARRASKPAKRAAATTKSARRAAKSKRR